MAMGGQGSGNNKGIERGAASAAGVVAPGATPGAPSGGAATAGGAEGCEGGVRVVSWAPTRCVVAIEVEAAMELDQHPWLTLMLDQLSASGLEVRTLRTC